MTYLPDFTAAAFSDPANIDNSWFPLAPGSISSDRAEAIEAETGEVETESSDHFVTFATREILGIESTVIRHTAFADGLLVEDTLDWYAQDDAGNVWYLGEISVNYNYDSEDGYAFTEFGGSWEAGLDGAQPGFLMLAAPAAGDAYYQEFFESTAEDEGEVIATGLTVEVGGTDYTDVVQIRDTQALDPTAWAYKYYAAGVGQVLEEEFTAEDPGEPELVVELVNQRGVTQDGSADSTELAFAGDGSEQVVTFVGEEADANGAIGAYLFDMASGEIGEARILFPDIEDLPAGASAAVLVPEGMSLGLFLVAGDDSSGLELEDFTGGGLFFGNLLSGEIAHLYDDNPETTFVPGPATIHDLIAPVMMDAEGTILPIRTLHAAGNRGEANFLNQAAGTNAAAIEVDAAPEDVTLIGFKEYPASSADYEAEFDDVILAVGAAPLEAEDLAAIAAELELSRITGTEGVDHLVGTEEDDQLIGLDGADEIHGKSGADAIEAGDGDDIVRGGDGNDEIQGEEGEDDLRGGSGADEIDGGEGDDVIFGGRGWDAIDGDEGDDLVFAGRGSDVVAGGDGDDTLFGNRGADRLSGGEGDDVLSGGLGEDVFVYDLLLFGEDEISDFRQGEDVIEIADWLGISSFAELEIADDDGDTEIAFGDGTVTLLGIGTDDLTAADFVFL